MQFKYKYAKVELTGSSDKRRKYKVRVGNRSSGTEHTKSLHRTKRGAENAADRYMKSRRQ